MAGITSYADTNAVTLTVTRSHYFPNLKKSQNIRDKRYIFYINIEMGSEVIDYIFLD